MIVTRFAPSPTGALHLGHAASALFAYRKAQEAGGTFLLRIEDIDPVRCKPEYIGQIEEDLSWLGLIWPQPVRKQSEHLADYAQALDSLKAQGVLYPCYCTRKEVQAEIAASGHAPQEGPDGPLYPGTCRSLSADLLAQRAAMREPVWRLNVAEAIRRTGVLRWYEGQTEIVAQPEGLGDVVLARKDVPTSYHLSVTIDDALQGVTLVTRGEDLRPSTHIHRLLQALLGLPTPRYLHHPLLRDAQGRRLAKRDLAVTLRSMREAGTTPQEIWSHSFGF